MPQENSDLKIILSNISELSHREKVVSDETDVCFSILGDILKEKNKLSISKKETFDEFITLMKKYCTDASPSSLIAFLKDATCDLTFPDSFALLAEDHYETFSKKKSALICYVKNNFNDAAYLCFSKLFSSTKVSYGGGFDEVCENVYNGICDYCILPIEDVEAGKLFSFYSLIDKYDLRIFAVTDVDEGTTTRKTRFALLSRNNIFFTDPHQRSYIEFSVIKDDSYDLSEILEAARAASLELYRIDTIPVPYNDLAFRFYHIFDINNEGFIPFLIYISIKYPQLKLVGHYILV